MNLPRILIKKEKKALIQKRHPWIYSGAIKHMPKELKVGDLCVLVCEENKPLAYGIVNPSSSIAFRVISFTEPSDLNPHRIIESRLLQAITERKSLIDKDTTNAYRLINAEADGLPGLVVDIYQDVAVFQISTAFIDLHKKHVIDTLVKNLPLTSIYEKSTAKSRSLEGLPSFSGWIYGEARSSVSIHEHGIHYEVDVVHGQKTGFFIDQREMRFFLRKLAASKTVLNSFAYTGGFSLNALAGGAKKVVSIDSSESACKKMKEHEEKNQCSAHNHTIICEDVFKFLKETDETFDVVILDPPAFVKKPHDVTKGFKHYLELNRLGLRVLKPSGILLSFSCSPFFSEEDFSKMLSMASSLENRNLKIIGSHRHGLDHPVLVNHPEGRYLKGTVLKELIYDRT